MHVTRTNLEERIHMTLGIQHPFFIVCKKKKETLNLHLKPLGNKRRTIIPSSQM
jgi:hypothetical protein